MDRFFEKAHWVGDCLEWNKPPHPDGYGQFWYKGKTRRAHRVAYELAYGPFDDSLLVRHTCDNKVCVNYKHLILGTNLDNSQDNAERGLMPRGEDQWSAKLTESLVLSLREEYAQGVPTRDLVEKYGLHRATVAGIAHGRTWKHVGGPIAKRSVRQRLTDEQVCEIVELTEQLTDTEVAVRFGVSQPYVTRLKNGNRRNGIRTSRNE